MCTDTQKFFLVNLHTLHCLGCCSSSSMKEYINDGQSRQTLHYKRLCVISGLYMQKCIWTSVMGEQLVVEVEEENEYDHHMHAVAIIKNGFNVWHDSCFLSSVY